MSKPIPDRFESSITAHGLPGGYSFRVSVEKGFKTEAEADVIADLIASAPLMLAELCHVRDHIKANGGGKLDYLLAGLEHTIATAHGGPSSAPNPTPVLTQTPGIDDGLRIAYLVYEPVKPGQQFQSTRCEVYRSRGAASFDIREPGTRIVTQEVTRKELQELLGTQVDDEQWASYAPAR